MKNKILILIVFSILANLNLKAQMKLTKFEIYEDRPSVSYRIENPANGILYCQNKRWNKWVSIDASNLDSKAKFESGSLWIANYSGFDKFRLIVTFNNDTTILKEFIYDCINNCKSNIITLTGNDTSFVPAFNLFDRIQGWTQGYNYRIYNSKGEILLNSFEKSQILDANEFYCMNKTKFKTGQYFLEYGSGCCYFNFWKIIIK